MAVTAFSGSDDGCHYNRLAHLYGHSAISLFGDVATANRDFFIANFGGYLVISHFRLWLVAGETSVKHLVRWLNEIAPLTAIVSR